MEKYGIYEVRYNDNHSKIVEVRTFKITDNKTDGKYTFSREAVILKIGAGNTVITLTKKADGNWKNGSEVIVYTVDTEKFIKTESNSKKADNLGELPEY